MTLHPDGGCPRSGVTGAYALRALPEGERAAFEAHLAGCPLCRRELEFLAPAVDAMSYWPTDVLRPPPGVQARLALRIPAEPGSAPGMPAERLWLEPEWKEVAPGISCKLLASDFETHMVSMLVRLAPGTDYPPHTHAGVEELHLLEGELWIDERKLFPGDYNRALPGTGDRRVWSETGCTCVLVTSARDVLL